MKKIILSLAFFACFKANSQTVDSTVKSITAMKVEPIFLQINYPKKDTVTHIGLRQIYDDLKTTATFEIILLAKGKNIVVSTQTIAGDEYIAWNGNNIYPFIIFADRLGLTFKN